MDWLTKLTGSTRARLLVLVRGAARSINELADALGITDNAVRTHVTALERDGLVQHAGTARSTGGKPARLYELTPEAEELFPKAYSLVLAELVRTLKDDLGADEALNMLRRVGERLATGAVAHGDGDDRVTAAVAVLESIGGAVTVSSTDTGWLLSADGCPLSGVVAAEADACKVAEALVQSVTGLPVTETCDRSARPRCAFRIDAEPVSAGESA